jgi:hypothetical protein
MWIICRYYAIYDIQTHIWVHGNDHTLYIYINYLYLLNTIQWILVKVPRTQTHRHAQCFPGVGEVVIYYLVCSRLLHCKRIFPNSKEKNIAYLQMSVDHYIFYDMQRILINYIKIHYECILYRHDEKRNCLLDNIS